MNLIELFNLPEKIKVFQYSFSMYFVLGHFGYVLSLVVNLFLCHYLNLSYVFCILLYVVTLFTFYATAFIRSFFIGYESYVLLRQALLANLVVWTILQVTGASINIQWHYLDLFVIALGLIIVFGRIGCQTVGCCQGRPCNCLIYVTYPFRNSSLSFVDKRSMRFIPVQFIEASYAFILVLVCLYLKLNHFLEGRSWVLFWVLYLTGRYFFEFLRGDPERPYWMGFSEAQLIVICVFLGVTLDYFIGFVDVSWVYLFPLISISTVSLFILFWRWRTQAILYEFFDPKKLMDFAQVATRSRRSHSLQITHQGIKVFVSDLPNSQCLYTVSQDGKPLSLFWGKKLLMYLSLINHYGKPSKFVVGQHGVYHLIVDI